MGRITGIGGIFFKAQDPEKLRAWYQQNLGFGFDSWGGVVFQWKEEAERMETACTIWCPFPSDTKYFEPSSKGFMMNFRVSDLDGLLRQLKENGAEVDPRCETEPNGKFGWVMDPEGNRIELWEPA